MQLFVIKEYDTVYKSDWEVKINHTEQALNSSNLKGKFVGTTRVEISLAFHNGLVEFLLFILKLSLDELNMNAFPQELSINRLSIPRSLFKKCFIGF